MSYLLCSQAFKQFMEWLYVPAETPEESAMHVKKAITFIADSIRLGKAVVYLDMPKSFFEPDGASYSWVMYQDDYGFEDVPCSGEFVADDNSLVRTVSYPRAGETWSEKEKEEVRFLMKICYYSYDMLCLKAQVKNASMTDVMIGAANANGLMQIGKAMKAEGRLEQYNGAFLNIKNFKFIVQSLENRKESEILREYSEKIVQFLDRDEVFASLGGDRFGVLVRKERTQEFLQLVRSVPILVDPADEKNTMEVSARVGLYAIGAEDTIAEVMNGSTTALSIARNSGGNDWVWFEPTMIEKEIHAKRISVMFERGIEERQFVVYYQPKVSLADNKLCGSEALVRWLIDGKLIPPMEFIPVLERDGSIRRLDFYVFETVCQDIRRWMDSGLTPVKVSVNFSRVHLGDEDFAETILQIIRTYDIDPSYLELELTETTSYEDYESMTRFIQSMRSCGIDISIDDFGTGYSSLNLLKDLDVDIIKLDRSFVNSIDNQSGTDSIVIKHIVNLINELHMQTIAEGVETQTQADYLKSVNCTMAQGYLFDRPMPCNEFEKRLSGTWVYDRQ